MLSDITLGQFFPGNSLIHRLDPRIKIISIILLIVTIFTSKTYAGFAMVFALSILLIAISRIHFSVILKSLKPVVFILAFTMIANMLWTTGDTLLVSFWIINVYL